MSTPGPQPQETAPLLIVAGVAALTAIGRILYGKDPLTVRYVVGSAIGAIVAGVFLQFICIHFFGDSTLNVYASTAIGCGGGTFTEQIMRRVKWFGERGGDRIGMESPPTPVPVSKAQRGSENTPTPGAVAAKKHK